MSECRYVDGVVFRKSVAHKSMARTIVSSQYTVRHFSHT
jgi:hypothetical protein